MSCSGVVQLAAGGASVTSQIAWLGISATELACFVGFWGLQVKPICCRVTAGLEWPLMAGLCRHISPCSGCLYPFTYTALPVYKHTVPCMTAMVWAVAECVPPAATA